MIPGFFDIFKAPIIGFAGNSSLIAYIIVVSFFVYMVEKYKIIEKPMGRLFTKIQGKEV
jgi:hypothetical protein